MVGDVIGKGVFGADGADGAVGTFLANAAPAAAALDALTKSSSVTFANPNRPDAKSLKPWPTFYKLSPLMF